MIALPRTLGHPREGWGEGGVSHNSNSVILLTIQHCVLEYIICN